MALIRFYLLLVFMGVSSCATLDQRVKEWEQEYIAFHNKWEHGIVYKPGYSYVDEVSINLVDNKLEFVMMFPKGMSFVYDAGGWPPETKIAKFWYRTTFKHLFGEE